MKKFWLVTLAVLNFLGFIIVSTIYYMLFLIPHGWHEHALTYGLPFPIVSIATLVSGIMTLKRKSWRWGIIGPASVGFLLVYVFVIFIMAWWDWKGM